MTITLPRSVSDEGRREAFEFCLGPSVSSHVLVTGGGDGEALGNGVGAGSGDNPVSS